MLELQPARLGQRPKLLNKQGPIAIRLPLHSSGLACSQRPSMLLQPASWYGQHTEAKV